MDSLISKRNTTKQSWFLTFTHSPRAVLRLFCFPYAGSSALVFRNWPNGLPDTIEVCAVQLPGRSDRLSEEPYTNLALLTEAIGQAMLSYLDMPFALFGHSLGAMISFEVARFLRRRGARPPECLFVAGRRAPHIPDTEVIQHAMPESELIEQLRQLNGTPNEVFDNPELLQLILPVIRADFKLAETYTYTFEPPLSCPIAAFCGLEDQEENRERLEAWREHTISKFSLRTLAGGHFFLHSSESDLLRGLAQELLCY